MSHTVTETVTGIVDSVRTVYHTRNGNPVKDVVLTVGTGDRRHYNTGKDAGVAYFLDESHAGREMTLTLQRSARGVLWFIVAAEVSA